MVDACFVHPLYFPGNCTSISNLVVNCAERNCRLRILAKWKSKSAKKPLRTPSKIAIYRKVEDGTDAAKASVAVRDN
jgi:hypothetical protein